MSRTFGPITQLGYVVHDIDAAMRHWIDVIGVGPFYHFPRVEPEQFSYRGAAHDVAFGAAIAHSGHLQIEFIQPLEGAPSLWTEFLDAGPAGLQHLAFWPDDFDAAVQGALDDGFEIGHQGSVGGGRFVYFDTGHRGTVIELSEQSGAKREMFQAIRASAADWDGSDPIRVIDVAAPQAAGR